MKALNLLWELLFALFLIAGVLCFLDLFWHLWLWFVVPLFASHPAGVCLSLSAFTLTGTLVYNKIV